MEKIKTSIRLSTDGRELIKLVSKKLGISQSAILELSIRCLAEKEQVKVNETRHTDQR